MEIEKNNPNELLKTLEENEHGIEAIPLHKIVRVCMITETNNILTKRKLILVGEENRYIYSEPTIAACPKELNERNGNATGGLTD